MLKREVKVTQDGSKTLFIPDWNESYHSKHGALNEAIHVFLKHGLDHFKGNTMLQVLEYGFGTGLNCLLSLIYANEHNISINYTSLEKFPISQNEIETMDFSSAVADKLDLNTDLNITSIYKKIHAVPWNNFAPINDKFKLKKINIDFRDFSDELNSYDVVFFDAFGIRVQPELWEESIFENIYKLLKNGGLLTTYAANGKTKRALQTCGFMVEKLAGPPGKREMINAWKK